MLFEYIRQAFHLVNNLYQLQLNRTWKNYVELDKVLDRARKNQLEPDSTR